MKSNIINIDNNFNGRQQFSLKKNHKLNYSIILTLSLILSAQGLVSAYVTVNEGLGIWGINDNVCWAFDITNFIYWIGLAHSGTLLSAILFLLRQQWRSSFSRSAETMTIIAILIALLFPLIHTGRPWFAWYWLFPYPNDMGLMPNFQSALIWDYFAIPIYFVVSILFWYLGLMPDFARSAKILCNSTLGNLHKLLSLGWKGSLKQWSAYKITYLILAGISAPLVITVHSIVSFDFSVTLVKGWHLTIFPPYFVVGAIFSGCALVLLLKKLKEYFGSGSEIVIESHYGKLNKIILTSSLIIFYAYLSEIFFAFYSADVLEIVLINRRIQGDLSILFYTVLFMNILIPQLLWWRRIRESSLFGIVISISILVGMWLERYLIVVGSLEQDYFSGNIGFYYPTLIEISLLMGSFGIFFTLYLISIKILPRIKNTEIDYKLLK